MKKVAVIGAGTMGNGIAHTFAQSGIKVNLIDISQEALDKAIATITKNLGPSHLKSQNNYLTEWSRSFLG